MSQSDFGNLSSPLNGTTFFNTELEPWRDAVHSTHSGASRPSYVVGGMIWLNTTTNPWVLNIFDGSDDIPIGTLNTTTNVFTVSTVFAATAITYSNGTSGLTATTVQAALDEIVTVMRLIPQNSKSANYTTVLTDAGKSIVHPSSDANNRTITIDSNANVAYPLGAAITFINDSVNALSIAITSDTLVWAGTGTTGTRSLAQYGMATAIKIGSTRWYISGVNLS